MDVPIEAQWRSAMEIYEMLRGLPRADIYLADRPLVSIVLGKVIYWGPSVSGTRSCLTPFCFAFLRAVNLKMYNDASPTQRTSQANQCLVGVSLLVNHNLVDHPHILGHS